MRIRSAVAAVALLLVPVLGAQTVADHIALGDKAHAAMDATDALKHYEAAMAADPRSYEALWKASREAVDAGEFNADARERSRLYKSAELYARRAVEANPRDPEGHFHLARALGRNALTLGSKERVKYAGDVRAHALEALKLDPKHPGALHVMGVWNAEVMRLSGVARWAAKNFLGGQVFGSASWKEAVRYMEQAVEVDPKRITHRLDLGMIYDDMKDKAKARAMYESVVQSPPGESGDAHRKRLAQCLLSGKGRPACEKSAG